MKDDKVNSVKVRSDTIIFTINRGIKLFSLLIHKLSNLYVKLINKN